MCKCFSDFIEDSLVYPRTCALSDSFHRSYYWKIFLLMSLSPRATVELQLIMQCCDQSTLFSLSHSCKFALARSNSDFAWRFIPSLSATFSGFDFERLQSSTLMRHCNEASF